MLINLRNALMAGKRLPYDAEVEYLEGTGTQWIDTGVLANGEFDVEYTIQTPSSADFTSQFMVGGARSASQHLNFGQYDSNGRFSLGFLGNYWTGAISVIAANTLYTVKIHYAYGSQTATINGMNATSQTLTGTEALNLNVYLFKRNFYGVSDNIPPMKGRMYAFKMWRDGVLVGDYIPVRKGTVGYLYDRVTGKLFGNAGTGDFVLGPDVVPVEWLESHGTEWIDTGVVPTAADSFYCRVKQNVVTDQCFWGLAGVAYCFSNAKYAGQPAAGTYWGHPAIGYGGVAGVNPLGGTDWHEILCQPSGIFVDGVKINTQVTGSTQSPLNTVALFARAVNSAGGGVAKNGQGRMSAFRIERNGDPLRKYLPVRVGTEGAMIDTLTRRIYRNAGTGAFTYGNDLKYPIPAS